MKRNISNSFLLLGIIVITSCHSKKLVTRTPASTAVTKTDNSADAAKMKLAEIRSKQISFTTFSGKAKTKLNIDGNSNDVTLNIRILRGQKIWVSITYLIGIEVARALITPDSITVINKLQSVYFQKPFSFIYDYAPREVNFNTVQSILIGNAIPETLTDGITLTPDNNNLVLSGSLKDMLFKMILGADLKINSTNLSKAAAGQSLQANYSNFIQATGRVVPSHISLTSKTQQKNIEAEIDYSRIDFDQTLDFPFSIPNRYQRIN
ncbi:DUF4292 domain-containing protein [Mucilaginibacter ginkgonis]|uniref:DUF4292 domain-containing protein n=1 Tax=Mucilaginibacter ginkgonis TaxID=2682091 RepID=A0A6I4I1T7_9SPHI|nr:DUF4292 domain-containing protein [Mucilaginibacter ginkgonis]QQL48791.1 DUF4292 domain-containing protein [Mucilaginibacter ginkgonis]